MQFLRNREELLVPEEKEPFFSEVSRSPLHDVGMQIDRYQLLSVLGEGGYGVVYLAEQRYPLKRKVAVKIIKPGMDTKEVLARFELERQALALLDHPNIAQVHDAGFTGTGHPYFVMEYIEGIPITKYCDQYQLNIEDRLNVFIQVCEAIQHAHQKGIIHRDIKPTNILVYRQDGKAIPKIIDFGVAKALVQPLSDRTFCTEHGQLIGTPEYMSPEQAEMAYEKIDTRTDIYSLGILLYELLTGALPFDIKALREKGVDHVRKVICEDAPTTPSAKLSRLPNDESNKLAHNRQTDVRTLKHTMRGDLDWITIKALEKDCSHRYATVIEVISDIKRHLNHEPVLAGSPGPFYYLNKFVRKHRVAVSVIFIVLMFCTVIAFSVYQSIKTGKERNQTNAIKHRQILSKAQNLYSNRQYDQALSEIEPILTSSYVGPEVHLLHAQLLLELKGFTEAVTELESLLNESKDISGQAHFLLAKLYYDTDPDAPGKTDEFKRRWGYHRQKAEELLSGTAQDYFLRAMSANTVASTQRLLNEALKLDRSHYESLKEKVNLHYLNRNYDLMATDAARMTGIQPNNPLGFSQLAIALRELKKYGEAIENHNIAIQLFPQNPYLYDQRRETYMMMDDYENALVDARKCIELRPNVNLYRFNVRCVLVALGRYNEAHQIEYSPSGEGPSYIENWAFMYVFRQLGAHKQLFPPGDNPMEPVLLSIAYNYDPLAAKSKRVATHALQADWSPDNRKLAYSRGIHGTSGVEILDLTSGHSELLVMSGGEPIWSPDGNFIAYSRYRQILPASSLIDKSAWTSEKPTEIWIIRADGSQDPQKIANGMYYSWSQDSRSLYYHSRIDGDIYNISIEAPESKAQQVIFCPGTYPTISPDEKFMAYSLGPWIRVVEIATGKQIVNWLSPPINYHYPIVLNWSPDSQKMTLSNYGSWLCIFDITTQSASMVQSDLPIGSVSWSREDNLAFTVGLPLYNEIWTTSITSLLPGKPIATYCQDMIDRNTRWIEQFDTDPDNTVRYNMRAEYYLYLGKDDQAYVDLAMYADRLKNGKKAAETYNLLAYDRVILPQNMFDPKQAMNLAYLATTMDPQNIFNCITLGIAQYRAGQWNEAVATLKNQVDQPEFSSEGYFTLAMAHWQLGNKEEATRWYGKGTEWRMHNKESDLITLGIKQYRSGLWKEAIDTLEKQVNQPEFSSEGYYTLAMAHWQLGNKEEAIGWYKKAEEWQMQSTLPQVLSQGRRALSKEAGDLLNMNTPKDK
jgi:serine/threonine protein kinase/Flp pilus assembly protein TadD